MAQTIKPVTELAQRVIDITDNRITRDLGIKSIAIKRLRAGADVHAVFAFIAQQCDEEQHFDLDYRLPFVA